MVHPTEIQQMELSVSTTCGRGLVWQRGDLLIFRSVPDNHAYSVIECKHNICGSGIDLLLIRNPWGRGGDIKNGESPLSKCRVVSVRRLLIVFRRSIQQVWQWMGPVPGHQSRGKLLLLASVLGLCSWQGAQFSSCSRISLCSELSA